MDMSTTFLVVTINALEFQDHRQMTKPVLLTNNAIKIKNKFVNQKTAVETALNVMVQELPAIFLPQPVKYKPDAIQETAAAKGKDAMIRANVLR